MKKQNIYSYIAVSLAILVPVPGRFAYGIILLLAINFFMLTGTLFRKVICSLSLQNLQPILIAVFLVAMAILFKQFLILYSQVIALTLGLSIYMSAISSFMIGCLYEKSTKPLNIELKQNMQSSGAFSLFGLLFFLFRDLFGYGTITLPASNGLHELTVFGENAYFSPSIFWTSIPGAIIFAAIILVLYVHIAKKMEIVESTMGNSDKKETESEEKK